MGKNTFPEPCFAHYGELKCKKKLKEDFIEINKLADAFRKYYTYF